MPRQNGVTWDRTGAVWLDDEPDSPAELAQVRAWLREDAELVVGALTAMGRSLAALPHTPEGEAK